MTEPKLITAQKLAQLLQVSVETIWRYTRSNRIPYVKLAQRKYRYNPTAVLESLNLLQVQSPCNNLVQETEPTYTTDKVYTYEDYRRLPGEGYAYEVLAGVLVKEPTPHIQHQRVSKRLLRILEDYFLQKDPNAEILSAPVGVKLSETNVLQPDLVYVAGSCSAIVDAQSINGPPHLIVEILTPATRAKDRIKKRTIYEQFHVPHYWIVDPEALTIEAYTLQDEVYVLRGAACGNEPFTHRDFPGLVIELLLLWKTKGA